MPTPIQTVLDQIAKRVVPSEAERRRMSKLAEKLRGQVQNILDQEGFGGKVSIQGSFARDTWLSGEADLDIFTGFPPSMDRQDWTEKVLPAIRRGIGSKTGDSYAEHPYLEFHMQGLRINVVPAIFWDKSRWK